MKFIFNVVTATLLMAIVSTSMADEFTQENVTGKWLWTHMIMDGGPEYKVDNKVEFQADGTYIQYDATGNTLLGRASWEISENTIIYNDKRGEQKWKLVLFEGDKLHVDHRGAEMFFERQ